MAQLLAIFFSVIFPVFVLVLVGFVVGPRLELDARSLSRAAYSVFTPCFVFTSLYNAEIEAALAVRMIGFIAVVEIGCILAALLIARLLRRSPQMTAAYVMIAVFGNVGNFGFPIIQFALGDAAIPSATVYFLTILVIAFTASVAAANWERGGSTGAFIAVLKTPALLAVPPAILLNWLSLELPLAIARPVALLGTAMIPVMLLTLGVQLADAGIPRPTFDTWVAVGIRLLVSPALALLLAAPFALDGIERSTGILQASMPTAVLVAIIANETNLLPTFVTSTVLFSTLASVVTLTVVTAFFVPLF